MSVVFLDQFTDVAVTALSAHTPAPTNTIGASWSTPDNGGFIYTDGITAFFFNGTIEVLDTGLTACNVSVDVILGSATCICGLLLRYQDSTNFWFVWIRNDTNHLQLYKQISGSNTLMDSQAYTVPTNTTVTLTATITSGAISVSVSGGPTVSASDSALNTATKAGMNDANAHAGGGDTLFDNFTVDDGSSPPSSGKTIYPFLQGIMYGR